MSYITYSLVCSMALENFKSLQLNESKIYKCLLKMVRFCGAVAITVTHKINFNDSSTSKTLLSIQL